MDLSGIAEWLNSVFLGFDYTVLSFLHYFAKQTDGRLTETIEVISLVFEKGLVLLIAGIILFGFKKTRRTGFCLAGAVCCSAVITLILKDAVARPRPFVDAAGLYHTWWQFIGVSAESGFAFPSGHTTVIMAAATALFFSLNKKFSWLFFLFVIVMGVSRCYLMVHYPSDILGGIIAGAAGAVTIHFISPLFFGLLNKVPLARRLGVAE